MQAVAYSAKVLHVLANLRPHGRGADVMEHTVRLVISHEVLENQSASVLLPLSRV